MKTLKQQMAEVGASIDFNDFRPFPIGKRAKRTLQRKKIAQVLANINQIGNNIGQTITEMPCHFIRHYSLPLDDLQRFTKLMKRLPTEEDYRAITRCGDFKLWFSMVYINAQRNEDSVFWIGSPAYNLYHSL